MAIEKKRKRLRVKSGETVDIPSGYEPKKVRGNITVYEKIEKTSSSKGGGTGQYREPTEEEKSKMKAGTFYGSNPAQYRENENPTTSIDKKRLVVKQPKEREPRMSQEDRQFARNQRKAERVSQRTMNKMSKTGCPIFRGRRGY